MNAPAAAALGPLYKEAREEKFRIILEARLTSNMHLFQKPRKLKKKKKKNLHKKLIETNETIR